MSSFTPINAAKTEPKLCFFIYKLRKKTAPINKTTNRKIETKCKATRKSVFST